MKRNPEVDKHLKKAFGDTLAKERDVRSNRKHKNLPVPINREFYKPKTQEEFEQLADELWEWAKLENSIDLNDFPISKKISPYKFKRFQNDYFQEMLELVTYIINGRTKKLVNQREYEKEIFFKYLRLMDKDYREDYDDQIAKRVAGAKEALGNITIVDHMLEKE